MSKYDSKYKTEIVRQVLELRQSYGEVARKNGLSKSDVRKWVEAYQAHGMEGLERKRISYPGEFKQAVVEDMRNNHLSRLETAVKYNLGNHHVAEKWERIYLEEGPEGLYTERRGRVSATSGTKKGRPAKLAEPVEEDLIAEVQRLRAEVAYLKNLQALVLEDEQRQHKKRW